MLGNDRKMEMGCNYMSGLRRLIFERKLVVGNTLVRFKMFGECLETIPQRGFIHPEAKY